LSDNFIIYDNDKEILKDAIRRIKARYNPYQAIQTFSRFRPELYGGDIDALDGFLRQVENGTIHSRSHEAYPTIHEMAAAFEAWQKETKDAKTPVAIGSGGKRESPYETYGKE